MNGRGSLAGLMPYSNANDVVVSMASDVLPVVKHTPVIAGVCASDPGRDMGRFLRQLKDLGFAGVQNFPTVGLIDGNFRQNLEETGMGYETEVEMVRIAHEMDLVTTPYVFNPEEAKQMAEAGADVIVAHSEYTFSLPLLRDDLLRLVFSGIDKFRHYRGADRKVTGTVCRRYSSHTGCGEGSQRRRYRALSWRTDCEARGCEVCA
jgi:hypothetical protein